MQKKETTTRKKLALHRETLRRLETRDLERALGGTIDTSIPCFIESQCGC